MEETNLPEARLPANGRTTNQRQTVLRLWIRERDPGWKARIDTAIPDRAPLPKARHPQDDGATSGTGLRYLVQAIFPGIQYSRC